MPDTKEATNQATTQTTNKSWWRKFKQRVFSLPVKIAEFIVVYPGAAETILNKKRKGVFSKRNYREEILKSPEALSILLSAQPPLNLPPDLKEEMIISNFNFGVQSLNGTMEKKIEDQIGTVAGIDDESKSDELKPYEVKVKEKEQEIDLIVYKASEEKPFDAYDVLADKTVKFVKVKNIKYVYDADAALPMGVTQHKSLDWLYMSIAPEVFAIDNPDKPDQYLKTSNKTIGQQHPKKKQRVIVLGRRELNENIKTYEKYATPLDDKDDKIKRKKMIEGENGVEFPQDVYYLQVSGPEEFNLNSESFETVYDLVDEASKGKSTLTIHCQQGIDRTGVFTLAAQLLQKFDTVFSGTEQEIAEKVQREHLILRQSRGPNILLFAGYLNKGIQLAFVLKAIEIQRKIENKLKSLDSNYAAQVLIGLKQKKSWSEKSEYLQTLITGSKREDLKACLAALKNAIDNRMRVETKLQQGNKFAKTFIGNMSKSFAGFLESGQVRLLGTEAKEDVVTSDIEQIKAYWQKQAELVGVEKDSWFLKMFDFLIANTQRYSQATKQIFEKFAQKLNNDSKIDPEQFVKKALENFPSIEKLPFKDGEDPVGLDMFLEPFYKAYNGVENNIKKDANKILRDYTAPIVKQLKQRFDAFLSKPSNGEINSPLLTKPLVDHLFVTFDELQAKFKNLEFNSPKFKSVITAALVTIIESTKPIMPESLAVCQIIEDCAEQYAGGNWSSEDCLQALQKKYQENITKLVEASNTPDAAKSTIQANISKLYGKGTRLEITSALYDPQVRNQALQSIVTYGSSQNDAEKLYAVMNAIPQEQREQFLVLTPSLTNQALQTYLREKLGLWLTKVQVQAVKALTIGQMKQGELGQALTTIIGKPVPIEAEAFAKIKAEQVYHDFTARGTKLNTEKMVNDLPEKIKVLTSVTASLDKINKTLKKNKSSFLPWRKDKSHVVDTKFLEFLQNNAEALSGLGEFQQNLQNFKLLQQAVSYLSDEQYKSLDSDTSRATRKFLEENKSTNEPFIKQCEDLTETLKKQLISYQESVGQKIDELYKKVEELHGIVKITEFNSVKWNKLMYQLKQACDKLDVAVANLPDAKQLSSINDALGLSGSEVSNGLIRLRDNSACVLAAARNDLPDPNLIRKPGKLEELFAKKPQEIKPNAEEKQEKSAAQNIRPTFTDM